MKDLFMPQKLSYLSTHQSYIISLRSSLPHQVWGDFTPGTVRAMALSTCGPTPASRYMGPATRDLRT